MNKFKENSKLKLSLMLFVAIGVIAVIMGFTDSHHTRIWTSLLFNNLFFTGIALFGVFFVALQYVSQAGWSTVFKRIPEAVSSYLPLGGGIMLLVVLAGAFDLHHIYHLMDLCKEG